MLARIPHRGLVVSEHQECKQARSYLSLCSVSISDVACRDFFFFEEKAEIYSGSKTWRLAHKYVESANASICATTSPGHVNLSHPTPHSLPRVGFTSLQHIYLYVLYPSDFYEASYW